MTAKTLNQAVPTTATKALTFDERLALAALAVDARINSQPFNLADVIRIPVEATPPASPASSPYSTPIAATLHRARIRLETDGWCRDNLVDESGAICPIRAIRLEAASRAQADDACILLLDVIQQHFADAETIPSWNSEQTSPAPVLLQFDRATQTAHTRGI